MHSSTTRFRRCGVAAAVSAVTFLAIPAGPASADPLHTLCPTVGWVGDSTSVNMLAEGTGTVTPNGALSDSALAKALFTTGVQTIYYDIASGRSAVEKVNGRASAVDALAALPTADCDVAAIGTNDAGTINAGSSVAAGERIERLIKAAHGQPLLMMTVRILGTATTKWFTPAAADAFNTAIYGKLPTNSIIDWARYAKDTDFYADGIHYTPAAGRLRSRLAALVLAGQTIDSRNDG